MNNRLKTARLLFVAMTSSLLMYLALGFYLPGMVETGGEPMDPDLWWVLMGVAAVLSWASFMIPRLIVRGADVGSEKWFVGRILAWAMSEAVALFGLVGNILVSDNSLFILMMGWALVLMALHAPRAGRTPEGR